MIPDSYDIVDLHKELKSERKAMAVRSSIFNFFLGVSYLFPRLTASGVTILGFFVIFCRFVGVSGVEKLLKLIMWIDRKCDRLNSKLDKNYRSVIPDSEHQCPHCRQEPNHRLVAVTGNCNVCGASLLETTPEPDTPEMMDWNKLHRYAKIQELGLFYSLGVLLPFLFLLKTFQDWRLFWGIAGILFLAIPLFWQMVVLRGLRRKWQLNFRCPECNYQNKPSNNVDAWRFLLQTGHCANCRRKLVRDDDPGKGDDHA